MFNFLVTIVRLSQERAHQVPAHNFRLNFLHRED